VFDIFYDQLSPVLPLWLLRKSTRFHEKNTRFAKKTLGYKIKLTHSENAQKMSCQQ